MNSRTLRIISIVQERVDAFLKDIFDICQSDEDKPKSLLGTVATEIAICDAVVAGIRHQRNERTLFAHLATDIVHSIFGIALDLDRIHDPSLPLDQLDEHRQQLFRMRQVSSTWNKFLLSSPRYWQAINTASPLEVITAGIERSGSAPLCVYRFLGSSTAPMNLPEELQSCTRVQTIRSEDEDAYRLYKRLLRHHKPALQTLQLTGPRWPVDDTVEPLGNFPSIRHLTAKWWQPPSNTSWLAGLKELVLSRGAGPDTELLRVLSACPNLEQLTISGGSKVIVEVFQGTVVEQPETLIPPITLPRLQDIRLEFWSNKAAMKLIRRLTIPQCLRRTLRIVLAQDLGQYVGEYRQFVDLAARCTQYPKSASIYIKGFLNMGTELAYETENFQVGFGGLGDAEFIINNGVQEFQDLFKKPSLTVTIDERLKLVWFVLRSLSEQNVRTIVAHFRYGEDSVRDLLRVIGSRSPPFPHETMTSTASGWPFKSLKTIGIHEAYVNLLDLTSLVERYMHKRAKPLLEEIILVGCNYSGMEWVEAVERIGAIGVTLRGVECQYEE